ncbi:GntR family transcriptional regulator [Alteribacter natronophilus]|uniref:GntR family transcriptional regulator n=1 Tax=Alteribacter natronophilus TaxID=2583810 RepID=UPI00110E1C7F|nr:GntR family transcriptional regulator [Alteribacter natronophilus]TMW71054.1 GntR family transcriptional regulator [Alteribacter natronophilus]
MKKKLDENRPIFQQIKEWVEEDILEDELAEGDMIPSTNELAKFYGINPATARKGIQALVDDELIYKQRGIGMFVAEGAKKKLMNRRKEEFYDEYVRPLVKEARRIGMEPDELAELLNKGVERE